MYNVDMIQPTIVDQVIRIVKPELVISGDDHDDCVYRHTMYSHSTLEHSVGTFSWLQGNIYPSFGVMSFRPLYVTPANPNAPSFDLKICSLPPQLLIYGWYSAFGLISIIGTIFMSRGMWNRRYAYIPSKNELIDPGRFGFTFFALKRIVEMVITVLSYYVVIMMFVWF
jgi:hypothetical protein